MTDIMALSQPLQNLVNNTLILLHSLHLQSLPTTSRLLRKSLKSLLHKLNVLDTQLLIDNSQIPNGVNITLNVDDLSIIKAPDHLEDGIDSTDMRQERISQTGTRGSTAGQTGDIVDCQSRRDLRLGLVVVAEPGEAVIGDDDTGFFGVDGCEGEVGGVTQG